MELEMYIFAGPNGAGKTTAANILVPKVLGLDIFINADEIARGLNPMNPEAFALEAGKRMLKAIEECIVKKKPFALETTLSSKMHLRIIKKAKAAGYKVTLFYLYLEGSDAAVRRVASRVRKGGHNIPEDTIRRRYVRSLWNFFNLYKDVVHRWHFYSNSNDEKELVLLAEQVENSLNIHAELYSHLYEKYYKI